MSLSLTWYESRPIYTRVPMSADEKECEVPATPRPLMLELKWHGHVTHEWTPTFSFQVAALDVKATAVSVQQMYLQFRRNHQSERVTVGNFGGSQRHDYFPAHVSFCTVTYPLWHTSGGLRISMTSGGSKGRGFEILSISCSFWKHLANSYVGAPWRVRAPTSGKSWIRNCWRRMTTLTFG